MNTKLISKGKVVAQRNNDGIITRFYFETPSKVWNQMLKRIHHLDSTNTINGREEYVALPKGHDVFKNTKLHDRCEVVAESWEI